MGFHSFTLNFMFPVDLPRNAKRIAVPLADRAGLSAHSLWNIKYNVYDSQLQNNEIRPK